jgi:hypothetical protein
VSVVVHVPRREGKRVRLAELEWLAGPRGGESWAQAVNLAWWEEGQHELGRRVKRRGRPAA